MDNALALKANQSTTYTKTEVDGLLTPKATVSYVDDKLLLKADKSTTYTITQVDNALALKANQITTYTKPK